MQAQLAASVGHVRQVRLPSMTLQLGPSFYVPHTYLNKDTSVWADAKEVCGSRALAVSMQALPERHEEYTWSLQLVKLLQNAFDIRSAVPVARLAETGGHWLSFFCDPNETLDYASMRTHLHLLHAANAITFAAYINGHLTVTRLQLVAPEKPTQPERASCDEHLAEPRIQKLSPRQRVTIQTVLKRWEARGLSDLVFGPDDSGLNIMLRAAGCNQSPALSTMRVVLADPFGSGRAVSALTVARVLLQSKAVQRVVVVCEEMARVLWCEKILTVMPSELRNGIDVVSSRSLVQERNFDLCIADISSENVWFDLNLVRACNKMRHYIFIRHVTTLDDVCGCVAFDDDRARKLLREAMRSTQIQVNALHCRLVVQTTIPEPVPPARVVQVKLTLAEREAYARACMSLRGTPCPAGMSAYDTRSWLTSSYSARLDILRNVLCGVTLAVPVDAANAVDAAVPVMDDALPDAVPVMDAVDDAVDVGNGVDVVDAVDAVLVPQKREPDDRVKMDEPDERVKMDELDEMVVPSDAEDCIVCMNTMLCKTTLACGHSFCQPCIVEWLCAEHASCPICRHPADKWLSATQHGAPATRIVPSQPIASKLHALQTVLAESETKTVVVAHNAEHVAASLNIAGIAAQHVTHGMTGDQVYNAVYWFTTQFQARVLVTDVHVHEAGIDVVAGRVVLFDADAQRDCALFTVHPQEWVQLACDDTVDTADISTLREMMSVVHN